MTLASTLSIYAFTRDTLPKFILKDKKTIKLEYGEKYSVNGMRLLNTKGMDDEDKKILKNGLRIKSNFKYENGKDFPAIGEYEITMFFNDETLVKKVKVADTTAPELSTEYSSVDIVKATNLTTYDFSSLFSTTDLSPVEVNFGTDTIDANTVNSYILKAVAKDSSNNESFKDLTINITEAPNENQELITEIVTNEDGTKSIRNTLKEKEVFQENNSSKDLKNNSSKNSTSSSNKKNSSSGNNTSSNANQSFVANMSISNQTTQAITVVGNARVGKNGITSNKREGDAKTSTEIYSFGQAFGVAGNPGISRNWLTVNNNHYWIDDSNSQYYNKLVDANQTGNQWSSAEHLASYGTAYKYAIAVNYNTACTPGAGSAIFLHCSSGGSTTGCISISESNMIKILQNLQNDALIGIYLNSNNLY